MPRAGVSSDWSRSGCTAPPETRGHLAGRRKPRAAAAGEPAGRLGHARGLRDDARSWSHLRAWRSFARSPLVKQIPPGASTLSACEVLMRAAAGQCAVLLEQYAWCLAGLDDRHRALETTAGGKTAGWLIGHLVVTGDFARRLCGLRPVAAKEWRPLFAPGTQPSRDPPIYPPMKDMVDAFRSLYEGLAADAPGAPAA